jgi:hypothetical protein
MKSTKNFTNLKEHKKSNKYVTSSHLLTNEANTNQHLYRHTRDDSKSGGQQFTIVNNSGQLGCEKDPRSGTKPHHTTAGTGDHERED